MRASPNPSGEQLVTDYLTRVAQQARHLPKGARMAFVGRTRALVERELGGPGALTDPGHVSAVLDRLGTPEDLVIQERTRIDRDWVKKRAASKEEGEAAAAALTGPLNRSLTPRRRLNTDTQTGQRASPDDPTGPVTPVEGTPVPGSPGPRRPGSRSIGPRSTSLRGAGPRSTSLRGAGPRGAGLRSVSPQGSGPRSGGLRSADSPSAGPGHQDGTAPGTQGVSWNEMLANTRQLARDHLLETIAILLLGLGGLILWFPFWPIGAIVAMFSRLWDLKDKSLAIAGPLLVVLAGSVIGALIIGGSGTVVVVYFHAVGVDFDILIRVGCVLTAAYLAWRVTQGPRPKVVPWQRITRS
jgi:hypothetical protein